MWSTRRGSTCLDRRGIYLEKRGNARREESEGRLIAENLNAGTRFLLVRRSMMALETAMFAMAISHRELMRGETTAIAIENGVVIIADYRL